MRHYAGEMLRIFVFTMAISFFLVLVPKKAFTQDDPYSLKVGDLALDFTGMDQNGEQVSLYSELEKGPVVLLFYRGEWCRYCNKQLSQLEDSLKFISDKGGIVLAVTPEKPNSIDKTIKKTKASFKIIHDQNLSIMNTYHVTFRVQDAVLRKYKRVGLLKANQDNGPNLPVPATYIIGQDRTILYVFFDPDHTKRATVGQILQNL